MHAGGTSSNSSGHDPVMDDIAELKALLQNGGLTSDILEGKYLNQLRRARQLNVQLETERTRARQLTVQLEALREEKRKAGDRNSEQSGKEGRRRRQSSERATNNESDEGQQNVTALRERLDRAFVQLSDAKVQLEEQKKESQRLRKIIQQEVGNPPQDIEALLKGSSDSSRGWRGRAQQIVLLKSKVKELERALGATGGSSPAAIDGGGTPCVTKTSTLSLTTDAVTTTTVGVRDRDDVAREHVVELQSRRLLQQRELQDELARQKAELDSMKLRLTASQSRHANLEADNRQLREHLQAVLQKTQNDNDLIDAYREEMEELRHVKVELHQAKVELQKWEEWCSSAQQRNPRELERLEEQTPGMCDKSRDARYRTDGGDAGIDVNTAVALAGADTAIELNRLRLENLQLKSLLTRYEDHGDGGALGNESPTGQNKGQQDDMALLIHWLKSFISPRSGEADTNKGVGSQAVVSDSVVGVDWQGRVAEVLRRAHSAVTFLEKQQQEQGERLSKCYETIRQLQAELKQRPGKREKKPKGNHVGDGDATGGEKDDDDGELVNILLQENVALKQRVKVMQDLLNKERAAYESLRSFSAASGTSDAPTAAAYLKLKRDYEELRAAFNCAQAELLRNDAA
ncbi:hypothetical protein, conserved [Trypanosoma brucei gambiense DAL972]|uniref:Uncharacterized protein n=1 Tax=Trypanosoma brucei gambiense (strain MHOM/CI/86/DAL972) TaxID=679716 RepID=C9ZNZ7_TRYB9|nr:hypothetical protein, conserved [Trypanosoma brucei gambiense DAL972]CBH11125.1 hypothetical protein, conserved [Trypanosoma brucei gambiense DAL972]|eukprot:XP_011773412.1 hypothetical protein, conserved [Trypanosoma brucei gambiense DAL972]